MGGLKDMFFFVNGYGAAPLEDENYQRYLQRVAEVARREKPREICLMGGYTNNEKVSEAASMDRWFQHYAPDLHPLVRRFDGATTARGNVRIMKDHLHTLWLEEAHVMLFCEYSRRHTMRFFAWKYLESYEITGVPFDAASMRLRHRVKQVLLHLPLEVLSVYMPLFDTLRRKLRARHIARERQKTSPR